MNMNIETTSGVTRKLYVFDLFLGEKNEFGKVRKIRSAGVVTHAEDQDSYTIRLKTFINEEFFLLRDTKVPGVDYSILTRTASDKKGKKYFWHTVGEGRLQQAPNTGLLHLKWDLFAEDLFMDLHPKEVRDLSPDGETTL